MTGSAAAMPQSPFLVLREGGSPGAWQADVLPHLCVGRAPHQFLFGGTALAGCLDALERTFELPVSFASAQFISFARPNENLEFRETLVADGRSIKQAQIAATVGKRAIVMVQAALGRREGSVMQQGPAAPHVATPEDCPATSVSRLLSSNFNELMEVRLAQGRLPGREPWAGAMPGPLVFWARARDGSAVSRYVLAIVADCFSLGIPAAIGRDGSGNSLDNHIRFVAPPQGEWVLCAIDVEAVRDGLVHGRMRQYAQDGQLLAIAGQTMILRLQDA